MLTDGARFACGDLAATLASVLSKIRLAGASRRPSGICRTLLAQCLGKDQRQRIADMAIAIYVLDEVARPASGTEAPPFVLVAFDPGGRRRGWLSANCSRASSGRRS